jgi:hypothetical protein
LLIVDDHLTLLVVAGVVPRGEYEERLATTSLWYLRLVAAVTGPSTSGRLTRLLDSLPFDDRQAARTRLLAPPVQLVEVLHPMLFAAEMARVQRDQRVNLLAAEMLGAAIHYDASILVAPPNAGGIIERAASAEGVTYAVSPIR